MGIKVGGIDLAESTLNNELRLAVLEKLVEHLLRKLGLNAELNQEDIEGFRKEALKELQLKYPDAGIKPRTYRDRTPHH